MNDSRVDVPSRSRANLGGDDGREHLPHRRPHGDRERPDCVREPLRFQRAVVLRRRHAGRRRIPRSPRARRDGLRARRGPGDPDATRCGNRARVHAHGARRASPHVRGRHARRGRRDHVVTGVEQAGTRRGESRNTVYNSGATTCSCTRPCASYEAATSRPDLRLEQPRARARTVDRGNVVARDRDQVERLAAGVERRRQRRRHSSACRPIVLVTTPPQPASNARRMFDSDSVGGADDSRNGFWNRTPVNVVESPWVSG